MEDLRFKVFHYKTRVLELLFPKDQFDFITSKLGGNFTTYTEQTLKEALLISYHPLFQRDIRKAREKLGLKKTYGYPHLYKNTLKVTTNVTLTDKISFLEGKSLFYEYSSKYLNYIYVLVTDMDLQKLNKPEYGKDIKELSFKISNLNRKEFVDVVSKLITVYKLDLQWYVPLQLLLLTGVLQIPMEHNTITYNPPIDYLENSNITKMMFNQSVEELFYPSIIIRGQIKSKQELKNKVGEIWDRNIQKINKNIPPRFLSGIDMENFATGLWLWIQKEVEGHDWDVIENMIDDICISDENFFGKDELLNRTNGADLIYRATKGLLSFKQF